MMPLEEAKKKIIEKQKRCYKCGKIFDLKFDHPIFLYNLTIQDYKLISDHILGDLVNIIALCDVCHYTIKSKCI